MVDEWIPTYIKTVGEEPIATFLTILKDLDDIQYDDLLYCWMMIKKFVTNAAPPATEENHRTNKNDIEKKAEWLTKFSEFKKIFNKHFYC